MGVYLYSLWLCEEIRALYPVDPEPVPQSICSLPGWANFNRYVRMLFPLFSVNPDCYADRLVVVDIDSAFDLFVGINNPIPARYRGLSL